MFKKTALASCEAVGAGYCHHRPNQVFYLFQRVITAIVRRIFRRHINTSGSPELAIYRLSSSRLLAIKARVGHLKAAPTLSLFTSPRSSPKLDLVHNPDLPSDPPPTVRRRRSDRPVSVYSRGSPRPVCIHRSPERPSPYSRIVPARASPAWSPLVAVPDRSKGVVP